ncbi:prepilin peptidase [Thalassotalea aquiviva]|uniref:A24 family peptidase n=1 Tax=Thalassotalea aquiviva TaxID=3242415 RepID=UPI00352AA22B
MSADIKILLVLLVVAIAFVIATFNDLKVQRISNVLCLRVFIVGCLLQLLLFQLPGLMNILLGVLLPFVILFPLFYLRALGAGDIKLMMAVGPMLVAQNMLFSTLLYAVIFGGVTTLLFVIYQVGFKGIMLTLTRYWQCLITKTYFKAEQGEAASLKVPYAPALFLGWLWACANDSGVTQAFKAFIA